MRRPDTWANLALQPTPLVPLRRASARLGVAIWAKRDDLTGFALSGNKVRKLEALLAPDRIAGKRFVATTGGIQSNHCRATAFAARHLGLTPILLLRGAPEAVADGNLLLDHLVGAEIHWITPAQYAHRDALLQQIAQERGDTLVVPEGGSDGVGSKGYVRAGAELTEQLAEQDLEVDTVVCAVGSGGTLAGLAAAPLRARVLGVAVCDDRATFVRRVRAIGAELAGLGGPPLRTHERDWDVVEGFQGRGYGLSTPDELRELAWLARHEGVLLDPVYTGKAWFALVRTLERDPLAWGRRVVFWHTGGGFGLFGRGAEVAAALEGTDGAPVQVDRRGAP